LTHLKGPCSSNLVASQGNIRPWKFGDIAESQPIWTLYGEITLRQVLVHISGAAWERDRGFLPNALKMPLWAHPPDPPFPSRETLLGQLVGNEPVPEPRIITVYRQVGLRQIRYRPPQHLVLHLQRPVLHRRYSAEGR